MTNKNFDVLNQLGKNLDVAKSKSDLIDAIKAGTERPGWKSWKSWSKATKRDEVTSNNKKTDDSIKQGGVRDNATEEPQEVNTHRPTGLVK